MAVTLSPFIAKLNAILERIPYPLLALLVALLPALFVWFVLTILLGVNLLDFAPHTLNDQIRNWHTTFTFSRVGFNGGYYSPHELTAPVSFVRFDVIGPLYPMLYGTIAHFIGWQPYTPIFFNMAAIALALVFFIAAARLNRLQLVFTALLLLTFWPITLFMPTALHESPNHAFAIVLTGGFVVLIRQRGQTPLALKVFTGLLLIAAALLRVSWALLFLPYFLLLYRRLTLLKGVLRLAFTLGLTLLILLILQNISPPSNNTVLDALASFRVSPASGLQNLATALVENFKTLWSTLKSTPTFPIQLLHHLLLIGLSLWTLAKLRRRENDGLEAREYAFHGYNLGAIAVSGFFLYLAAGFPRVFAAHLLISLLLMVAFQRYRLLLFVIVTNLLFFYPVGYELAGYRNQNFTSDHLAQAARREQFAQYIVYDPNAKNPWCNTVLLPILEFYDSRVTMLPAGIGVSYVWNPPLVQYPLKSHYLLFDGQTFDRYVSKANVRLLARLPDGDLYLNLDADCEA